MSKLETVHQVDKLVFQNVVKKRMMIHYSEIESNYISFVEGIVAAGYNLKGPYYYSINNVPEDEIVDIEMFFPIVEDVFSCDGYTFQSYFEVRQLLNTAIQGNFEVVTEYAYALLLEQLEEYGLSIATPFYHVLPRNSDKYVNLYLGYYKESVE